MHLTGVAGLTVGRDLEGRTGREDALRGAEVPSLAGILAGRTMWREDNSIHEQTSSIKHAGGVDKWDTGGENVDSVREFICLKVQNTNNSTTTLSMTRVCHFSTRIFWVFMFL